jgi:hypothetical protein
MSAFLFLPPASFLFKIRNPVIRKPRSGCCIRAALFYLLVAVMRHASINERKEAQNIAGQNRAQALQKFCPTTHNDERNGAETID